MNIKQSRRPYCFLTQVKVAGAILPGQPCTHPCGLWLAVVLKLSPEQYCEALRVDYDVSFARLVTGVHYGSAKNKVEGKMKEKMVDWTKFDPKTCSFT
jgi:hypothetical protein